MRWINFSLGFLVLIMGALPFLHKILPENLKVIPDSGFGYSVIILILGVVIVIYSYKQKRHKIRLR